MTKRLLEAVKMLNASAHKWLRETTRGMAPDLVVSRTHHVRLGVRHVLDPHHVIVVDSLITERTTATLLIGLEGHVCVAHVARMYRQRCEFLQLIHEMSAPHNETVGSVPHVRHDQARLALQPLKRNRERTHGRRAPCTRNPVLVCSTFLQSQQQADMMITERLQILPGPYTITSKRSMPGQRLCNSWHRRWLSKQNACQSAQQATSGSVPVCTRSWSGCWMMQRSGTNWRAIWKCTGCHRPERDNRDQLHTSSTRNIPRPGDPKSCCTTTRLRSMPGETRRPEETQDDRAFALEETTCRATRISSKLRTATNAIISEGFVIYV